MLKPPNSKHNIFHQKPFPFLLEIWFGFMRSANHCMLFLLTFYTASQLYQNSVCRNSLLIYPKLLKLHYHTTWRTSYEMLIAVSVFSSSRPRVITKWYCSLLSRESSNCLTVFSKPSFLFLLIISIRFHNILAIALPPRFSCNLYTIYMCHSITTLNTLYKCPPAWFLFLPSAISASKICFLWCSHCSLLVAMCTGPTWQAQAVLHLPTQCQWVNEKKIFTYLSRCIASC